MLSPNSSCDGLGVSDLARKHTQLQTVNHCAEHSPPLLQIALRSAIAAVFFHQYLVAWRSSEFCPARSDYAQSLIRLNICDSLVNTHSGDGSNVVQTRGHTSHVAAVGSANTSFHIFNLPGCCGETIHVAVVRGGAYSWSRLSSTPSATAWTFACCTSSTVSG